MQVNTQVIHHVVDPSSTYANTFKRMSSQWHSLIQEMFFCVCVYLQHDTTVVKTLGALGVYENYSIPYSTAVMVELHRQVPPGQNQYRYIVQIWVRNDTDADPVKLTLPGMDRQNIVSREKHTVCLH